MLSSLSMPQSVMQPHSTPPPEGTWRLHRRVLPQHTDYAGVMWHGTYADWLEEARVEALAAAGLAYRVLAERGLGLVVVHLAITYRAPLLHGDRVEVRSRAAPRRGLRLPWQSWFIGPDNRLAAEAEVALVLVDLSAGVPKGRPLRTMPEDLAKALNALAEGPRG